MEKKLELLGNYIVITDIETKKEEFQGSRGSVTYELSKDNFINFYEKEVYKVGYHYTNLVKGDLSSWADLEELLVWVRTNTAVYSPILTTELLGESIENLIDTEAQGYYGLLTDFYFDGAATETVIAVEDVDQYVDVNFTIASEGIFDKRPESMKTADPVGFDPATQLFNLESLTTEHFGAFRASLSFDPDEDDGELSARLEFQRHSTATPVDPFPIEDIVASMSQGADTEYPVEPYLTFFIGDTINTIAPGDSGKCKFQIKSSVPGTVSMRALTWYIYR